MFRRTLIAIRARLERFMGVKPEEWTPLLLAAAYYFFVLSSYYMLRPVRETMGIERGYDKVPWLMTGTMLAMLAANPVYSWLVSRFPRRVFIPVTYRFFAGNMLLFFGLFVMLPASSHVGLGYAFYIWLSVFNLFVVSVFWSVMADRFSHEQGRRLFAKVAVGGTVGAMSGAFITSQVTVPLAAMAKNLGNVKPAALLMLAAIVPLELAVQCLKRLRATKPDEVAGREQVSSEPSPGIFQGLQLIAQSRYLQLICVYMLLFTLTSTMLYVQQAKIVEQTFADAEARTIAFSQLDLWTNMITLTTQLFLASRIMALVGVGGTLCIMPIISLIGFGWLWAAPSFAALAVFQVTRRGLHYAVDRPAREILYTLVGPDEKYKSKSFIDTFVYRGGDFLGGWAETWLKAAGRGAMFFPLAAGACVVWLAGAVMLGVAHHRRIRRDSGV